MGGVFEAQGVHEHTGYTEMSSFGVDAVASESSA